MFLYLRQAKLTEFLNGKVFKNNVQIVLYQPNGVHRHEIEMITT